MPVRLALGLRFVVLSGWRASALAEPAPRSVEVAGILVESEDRGAPSTGMDLSVVRGVRYRLRSTASTAVAVKIEQVLLWSQSRFGQDLSIKQVRLFGPGHEGAPTRGRTIKVSPGAEVVVQIELATPVLFQLAYHQAYWHETMLRIAGQATTVRANHFLFRKPSTPPK